MNPIFCGFQVWTASHVDMLAEAGFTHAVFQTYPLNNRVKECLQAANENGIKAIVQPPNLAVPSVPPEWRYRGREGNMPVTDTRRLWNYTPSIWNPHAARFVKEHISKLKAWSDEEKVPIHGFWASIGWEISLPRALGKGPDRYRMFTFDDYAQAAWDRDHNPSDEMKGWYVQDIYKNGGAGTAWAIKSLVEYTRTLCHWAEPWEPWLPICSPGLSWMDPQSGIGIFQFLWLYRVREFRAKTVWVIPCLYRTGLHRKPHHVASCSIPNRLFRTTSIVGIEGIYGLTHGNALVAKRDGFSGILMDSGDLTPSRLPHVKARLAQWADAPVIETPPIKQQMDFARPDLEPKEPANG